MTDERGFLAAVKLLPEQGRNALHQGDLHVTFRELAAAATTWRDILAPVIDEGDVVIVDYHASAIDFIATLLGTMAAGGVHLSSRVPQTAWDRLSAMGSRWHAVTHLVVNPELPGLGFVVDPDTRVSLRHRRPHDADVVKNDAVRGRILETSGTSGEPKWVYWTEDSLLADRTDWCQQLALTVDDVVINIHPLDFAHGMDVHVLAGLIAGAQTVQLDAGLPAPDIARAICDWKATYMSALPAHYDSIATSPSASVSMGDHLTKALTGGALLTSTTTRQVHERCGIQLRRLYGATECGIMCADLRPQLQSVAELRPMPGVEMRLRPIDDMDMETYRVGEPEFRRAHRAQGYWGDPGRTEITFTDGWYRSGDAVMVREDGAVNVLGRIDDVWSNKMGKLCSAGELIDAITAIDEVDEVAVFAPSVAGTDGRVTVLCRLTSTGADLTRIHLRVQNVMSNYGLVGRITLMSDWPRTSVGKPDRRALMSWSKA
ncbi:fatty acid--CoA ligase family protein [Rhodococcus sp. H36-A4]|uniref:class I adenylate-forming enzyme family protein n=1 Tax=Rhodococcus sp. H36-A4 TaxID=3004353 RepID=UPI0022B067E7|nr:fatty acid--CoA ligase family protein [Rhodococcus sp. H36-A4]MCZ4080498.1 fatty acid--CoA ligase family protein [Rhodococcus sp. H36-A4]